MTNERADTEAMLLVHRVIRREFGLLPALISSATGDVPRTARIATHAREMLDFLHVHHTGEDELIWPVLRARAATAADLIDRMQEQHDHTSRLGERLRLGIDGWESGGDSEVGERLAETAQELYTALSAHLDEEERDVLPLVAAHFSEQEWATLAKLGFAAVPGRRRLVILGHILEEADAEQRSRFLTRVPQPARAAFKMFGQRQHAREVASIRG